MTRTTLDIDDDVLVVAREVAKSQGISIGSVVSGFARRAIQQGAAPHAVGFDSKDDLYRRLRALGVVPFPKGDAVVTDAIVNAIRDKEGA